MGEQWMGEQSVNDRCGGARGQALPLVLVGLAVALVALAVLVRFGHAVDDAARARTAADAAALAGAAEGESAARRLATENGAVLVRFRTLGDVVEVDVQVGAATARARAERLVEWEPSGG